MFDALEEAHGVLFTAMRELEPGALGGEDAVTAMVFFADLEKMAAAGKAFCAARVAESNHWRRTGDRTPAHLVARVTGCSMAEAIAAVHVPERLRSLPETDSRFRTGRLTLAQARHITEAAAADPSAEQHLLQMADEEPLGTLREECLRVKTAALEDDEARHRAVHAGRYLRHWTDASGAFRLDASMTPEAGAEILGALKPLRRKLGLESRRRGCRERRDALAADALVELCRGTDEQGRVRRPRVNINLRVDKAAWERGHTQPGESCEIEGAGFVPVSVAHALADGTPAHHVDLQDEEVVSMSTPRRHIPARLRRALVVRDPVCVIAGCYERDDLEIDHVVEMHRGGRTAITNLCRLCRYHHMLKTHQGWQLMGDGNSRMLVPPELLPRLLTPA